MILPALFLTAPWMTERPTHPAPKMATLEPSSTLAVMVAAPYPVVMPQPSKQALSKGAFSVIATTEISATTVYWMKVEVPMKCNRSCPLHLNRLVPSGRTPLPCVARILPHKLVFPDLQNLHSLHSGVLFYVSFSSHCRRKNVLESDNVVTRLDVGHTLSNGFHDTSTLVTEDDRESTFGVLSGECVGICSLFSNQLFSISNKARLIPVWQTPVCMI